MPVSPIQNRKFTGVLATFTDPVPNRSSRDFTAVIVWGDRSSPTFGRVSDGGNGTFVVSGTHRFRQRGNFPLLIAISDAQGEHGLTFSSATVQRRGIRPRQREAVIQQAHAGPTSLSAMVGTTHDVHDLALAMISVSRGPMHEM
jgi:hypothetical protein